MTQSHLGVVLADDLPEYPFSIDERIDSHFFMPWERRRWLNSDMRLKATPECRAYYFDLICISYEQSPVGTLPDDLFVLSRLLHVDQAHLSALCRLDYGPLHKWTRCLCDNGEIRLQHRFVTKTLTDAISRKEDNRAKTEAANSAKRFQRLRSAVAGFHADLARNDAAILWMDEWLNRQGNPYRNASWIERAIGEWSNHTMSHNLARNRSR